MRKALHLFFPVKLIYNGYCNWHHQKLAICGVSFEFFEILEENFYRKGFPYWRLHGFFQKQKMLFCWYKDIPALDLKKEYILSNYGGNEQKIQFSKSETHRVKHRGWKPKRKEECQTETRIQSVEVSKESEIVCFRWGKMVQWESTDTNVFQQSWNWRIWARSLWYLRWIAQSFKFRPFKNWLIQTILIPAKILNWKNNISLIIFLHYKKLDPPTITSFHEMRE